MKLVSLLQCAVAGLVLSSCGPVLDRAYQPGDFEVTLELKKGLKGQSLNIVTIGDEYAGGVFKPSRDYKADEPLYGFIFPRRTGGIVRPYIQKDSGDHRLTTKDFTQVQTDIKFGIVFDREASGEQIANFLLDTREAWNQTNTNEQLYLMNVNDAWLLACDDDFSSTVRGTVAQIESFETLRTMWSSVDENGKKELPALIQENVNKVLKSSTNCPLRIESTLVSVLTPDKQTQQALSQRAQRGQKVDSVKELLEAFDGLNVSEDNKKLAETLLLLQSGATEITVRVD